MKRIIFSILFLMFALFGSAMILTADDSARIGQSLGVKIQLETPPLNAIPCSVYTSSNDKDMLDLYTYDSILNEPAGLKTNSGGYAFFNIPITTKYPVDTNYKVYAFCGNETSSSTFTVNSYNPNDILFSFIISVKDNPIAWIVGIIFIIVILILIRHIFKRR